MENTYFQLWIQCRKDDTIFGLYSVYIGKKIEGYFVFNDDNFPLIYKGSFFWFSASSKTASDLQKVGSISTLSATSTFFSFYINIYKPSNLVVSETYSQSHASYPTGVPEYYNEVVDGSCVPLQIQCWFLSMIAITHIPLYIMDYFPKITMRIRIQ